MLWSPAVQHAIKRADLERAPRVSPAAARRITIRHPEGLGTMTTALDSHIDLFRPGKAGDPRTLLMLHGTGGDEVSFAGLGPILAPGAAVVSVRGNVDEHGVSRFFRRLGEGVYDMADLAFRTRALEAFMGAWGTGLSPLPSAPTTPPPPQASNSSLRWRPHSALALPGHYGRQRRTEVSPPHGHRASARLKDASSRRQTAGNLGSRHPNRRSLT